MAARRACTAGRRRRSYRPCAIGSTSNARHADTTLPGGSISRAESSRSPNQIQVDPAPPRPVPCDHTEGSHVTIIEVSIVIGASALTGGFIGGLIAGAIEHWLGTER